MSFLGGSSSVGGGGPGALRFASTRGRIQGGSSPSSLSYPNQFFDIASTYLPTTVKHLFRWCRYYFLTNPLINATIFKLSEYPVTDIIFDHESPDVVKLWEEFFQDVVNIRPLQVEKGLDFFSTGNSVSSVVYPFRKYLTCTKCKFSEEARKIHRHWVMSNLRFRLTCPKCGHLGDATPFDLPIRNASGIRVVRWDLDNVQIRFNGASGESGYYYDVPVQLRNDVMGGKRAFIEATPQIFIDSLRTQKIIKFAPDNLFHMKRPSIAAMERGWGTPLILPALKHLFFLQIMQKAQESILLESIVPLRILFPQAGSATSDPYSSVNLVEWREHVAQEIARWRWDPSYIPLMPIPLGQQTVGGDGKALMLTQEIMTWSEQIVMGMGVPLEFIKGGMSYAGTNMSMRMLENAFIGYIGYQKAFVRFIMERVSAFMGWPKATVRFKPFKVADDIQRKAYLFQLNQANKISDKTLLADADLSSEDENVTMIRETDRRAQATKAQQIAMANIQGEAQLVMAKWQAKAQQVQQQALMAPQAPGEPNGGMVGQMQSQSNAGQRLDPNTLGGDIRMIAQQHASMIQTLPPAQQHLAMQNLQGQSPELADLVRQFLAQQGQQQPTTPQTGVQVDARPRPEQRAPRRPGGM